ncbi:T9SS type A sorting domain-containing protein, partial [Segetibacter aerophilus]|uniref:T9SS type A sorting domain-containing protein n=1 Tax=Segetibacter aerophilus TaxID=670293 RepID=UPI0011BD73DE
TYIITTTPPITLSGFATVSYLNPLNISSHTGQKPQAKTWKFAGKWWAALATDQGTKIFKLVGSDWTDIITLSTATNTKCDVRVVGDVVHLLLFRTSTSYVVSVEYDPATDKYKLWSKRNSKASITFETGTETATIDMDASGRMWIASDGDTDIRVRYSDFPYGTWSAPIILATGVTVDDICSITTLNNGKIGLFWSNQNTQRFGFRTHMDGDSPSTWSADENPASQSALSVGHGFSDDHLQLMLASDGTLYVAMKTSYDTDGYPKIGLLVRRPVGTWDNLYPVTTNLVGTRPMVILNESIGKVKVLYTSLEGGGDILYKEALISDLTNFSQQFTLFNGNYNYLTSTHQTYNPEIAVIVTDQSATQLRAAGFLGSDAGTSSSTSITSSPFMKATAIDSANKGAIPNTEETSFRVYPNPVSTNATVQFSLVEQGKYHISLYTTSGVALSVLSEGWSEAHKTQTITINCSNLNPGMYLLRLKTNNYTTSQKLIVR